MSENSERNFEPVWTHQIRAGKRTYFIDIKVTPSEDYYLSLTETKRFTDRNGRFVHERHKILIYREDLDNFERGLQEALAYIRQAKGADYGKPRPRPEFPAHNEFQQDTTTNPGNVSFEDLD